MYKFLNIFFLLAGFTISLLSHADNAGDTVQVKFETTSGDFIVELYPSKAPKTVENFLTYVDEGFYNGTIFHRVIKNFMIQGGGFTKSFDKKSTKAPIPNESDNGLKNKLGAISMARTQAVNSATAQFFINTKNNVFLDYKNRTHGYAVFGKVIDGYAVIENIENKPTGAHQMYQDVPVDQVIIKNVSRL